MIRFKFTLKWQNGLLNNFFDYIDDKKIKHYSGIQGNSKIHLIVMVKKKHPLYNKMYEIVRPHCNENETQKILSIFMRVRNL